MIFITALKKDCQHILVKEQESSISRNVSGQAGVITFFLRKLREERKLAAIKSVLGIEKANTSLRQKHLYSLVWPSRQEDRGAGQGREAKETSHRKKIFRSH